MNKADGDNCNKGNKQDKGRGGAGGSYRVVREGLNEQMTFEWRLKERGWYHGKTEGRAFQMKGTAGAKALRTNKVSES